MWYIPNDLLPGPMKEESRDALDLSSPGVARRRSSHHSLSACVHADGERLTCTYCENEAQTHCTTHRQRLCGDIDCFRKHRWSDKDQCAFVEPSRPLRGWEQHVLATLVALAVGLLVVSVVAL